MPSTIAWSRSFSRMGWGSRPVQEDFSKSFLTSDKRASLLFTQLHIKPMSANSRNLFLYKYIKIDIYISIKFKKYLSIKI